MLGGDDCVRLVTTRNLRVCPSTARIVRLGPMSLSEVSELLTRNVTALGQPDAARLAAVCGGWPLLANVVSATVSQDVAAGARPDKAVAEAGEALRSEGPQAFDVWAMAMVQQGLDLFEQSLLEHLVDAGVDAGVKLVARPLEGDLDGVKGLGVLPVAAMQYRKRRPCDLEDLKGAHDAAQVIRPDHVRIVGIHGFEPRI